MARSHRQHAIAALIAAGTLTATSMAASHQGYRQVNLVSDGFVRATQTDAHLVNPWGIAFNPTGFVWIVDNGAAVSTLYDGNGKPQSLVVSIPSPDGGDGAATGIVFNGASDLVVSNGIVKGQARFIFATEEGIIAGWAPNVDGTHALPAAASPSAGAIYKGLAIASTAKGSRLFATDFHNAHVDVFNEQFKSITVSGGFVDPFLPPGFAPFGIRTIDGKVYVTFALQDENREEEVTGPGLGYVDAFDVDGNLLARIASRGALNAPWGIALAPKDFGRHSGELLISNFGDGRINGFRPEIRGNRHSQHIEFQDQGPLRDSNEKPIEIDGLWGISFGNGVQNQPINALFFTAGVDDERHGLYGKIEVDPNN